MKKLTTEQMREVMAGGVLDKIRQAFNKLKDSLTSPTQKQLQKIDAEMGW